MTLSTAFLLPYWVGDCYVIVRHSLAAGVTRYERFSAINPSLVIESAYTLAERLSWTPVVVHSLLSLRCVCCDCVHRAWDSLYRTSS
jgi:hypothetical protein